MAHTDKDEVLALAIRDLIELNKADLGIGLVLYGDHTQIPTGTAAMIMAMGKRRQLTSVAGPGGMTENMLIVNIEIHRSVVSDEETNRRATDVMATAVEELLHADVTMGGIIIHGFIVQVDRGNTQFANGSMFRTVRMTYNGKTKTHLTPIS